MSSFAEIIESKRLASVVVDALKNDPSEAHPMQSMAALAFALGAMVASASQLGITKPGQSGKLLDHLFKLAESSAEDHLSGEV
jgi:hypothetical protein